MTSAGNTTANLPLYTTLRDWIHRTAKLRGCSRGYSGSPTHGSMVLGWFCRFIQSGVGIGMAYIDLACYAHSAYRNTGTWLGLA